MSRQLDFDVYLLVGAFLLCTLPAEAQEAIRNPEVSTAVQFARSIPVRDMAVSLAPISPRHDDRALDRELDGLRQLRPGVLGGPVADRALQTHGGPLVGANILLQELGVGYGFQNFTVPFDTPDSNAAIGDDASNQIVQWVNESYAVFNKATGALIAGPITGNTFWSGLGGACYDDNTPDPIAQYDKTNHRWVMTRDLFISSPPGHPQACIAVSEGDDATGGRISNMPSGIRM